MLLAIRMYYSVQKQTFKTRNRCHRGRKDSRTSGSLWFSTVFLLVVASAPARARSGRLAVQLHRVRRPWASTHYAPVQTRVSWGGGWRPLGQPRRALGCSRAGQSQLPGPPFSYGQFRRVLSRAPLGGTSDKGRTEAHPRRPPRWAGTPWANPRSNRWPTSSNRWPLSPARPPWPSKALPEGRTPSSPSRLTSRGPSETYRAGWCGSFPLVGRTDSRLHPARPSPTPLDGLSDQEGRPRSPRAHELRSCRPGSERTWKRSWRGRAALSAGSRREGCARGRGRGRIRGWGAGRLHWAWIGGDPARAGPAGSREPEPQLSGRDAHNYGPGVSESSRVAGLAAAAATAATVAGVGGRGVSR